MGMFQNLLSKIFSHAPQTASAAPASSAGGAAPAPGAAGSTTTSTSTAAPAPAQPAAQVDVAAILDGLAAKNSEKLDWKRSIVDLMKLVGMDSSLSARKELAADLHYSGDTNDSATMNMWLHKEVLKKIAENGGKVPQNLLS